MLREDNQYWYANNSTSQVMTPRQSHKRSVEAHSTAAADGGRLKTHSAGLSCSPLCRSEQGGSS